MVRMKTTDYVKDEEVTSIIRIVRCPYCKTFLKGIRMEVTAMKCWCCDEQFKIQQDPEKYDPELPGNKRYRTITKGSLE